MFMKTADELYSCEYCGNKKMVVLTYSGLKCKESKEKCVSSSPKS